VRTLDFAWPVGILLIMGALFVMLKTNATDGSQAEADQIRRNMFVIFTMPMVISWLCLARPLRIGLVYGFVLLAYNLHNQASDTSIYSTRSYFGIISVKEGAQTRKVNEKNEKFVFRQ